MMKNNTLYNIRFFLFALVALSFPLSGIAVYAFDQDRVLMANILSYIYGCGLFTAIFASLLPLRSINSLSKFQRIESLVLVYLGMSYVTHLSWELGWLIFHNTIISTPDSPWTYIWWAYIDGGDMRYATSDHTLISMEILSVCNGLIGALAITRFFQSGKTCKAAILAMTITAAVHLYSASLYYLSEILFGLPNVGENFTAKWIKFGLANSPWIICPWFVFWWSYQKMKSSTQ